MTERGMGVPARPEPTQQSLNLSDAEFTADPSSAAATNGAPPAGAGLPAAPGARSRRLPRPSVSILSKLLAMLLGVGILSAAVVGYVGYRNGTESLRDAAIERMVEVRQSRIREVTEFFENIQRAVLLDSRNETVVAAMSAFGDAFAELNAAELNAADQSRDVATVTDYYENTFIPQLEDRTQATADADILVPSDPAQLHLQSAYTVASDDFDEKLQIDDAGDGSAWSAAHVQYHPHFRRMLETVGFEDAMLIDPDGNIVYTAYKGIDLGGNVDAGLFADSLLSQAYHDAMRSGSVDFNQLTDLERYIPSLGRPSGFAVSPIAADGEIIGALAYQLPLDGLDRIMTTDQEWGANGLGETGETYLIGPDNLMRSTSRFVLEDPDEYRRLVVAAGTPQDVADRAVFVGGTVLLQSATSDQANAALRGETGAGIKDGYRGAETLGAWGPVDIPGLQWAIIAEINADEAYEPVDTFARNLAIAIGALVLAICVASLLLSQVFVRPLRKLLGGVQEVAAGNLDAQVPVTSRDEFGELGHAFNDMSRSLRTKADLLAEQEAENERMLLSLMPEDVARRYREGEETIAAEHSDVTVVFADLVGFDDFTAELGSDAGLEHINALVRGFDEAADRLGVERVRTLHNGYLASCGLVVPRVDSARRVVDFVLEMQHVVADFNAQHGADLVLRAGVDMGTVTSGLVGRQNLAYDMWGETVNLAYRLRSASPDPGIFVTQAVHDRLRDLHEYAEAGTIETASGSEPVWRLRSPAS